MASSNHSTEETCDLDEERAGRSVIVSNIPPGVTVSDLIIHFQRGRNGGGEVENVSMMKQSAVITFENPEVARMVVRKEQKLKSGAALQLQPYKSKQDGSGAKVFSKVTAQLEFDTLPMKPEEMSLLMDTMTSETKVTCHEASYAIIISGSFQEIQNAREYLLNHLQGKRAQNLQPSKSSVNNVDQIQSRAADENKSSGAPPDPREGNLEPERYETNQQFRDYFRRKYEEELKKIEKGFDISIQWDTDGSVILNPNPTCKPQMFREASESFCSLYQKVHKTFTRFRVPDGNSSVAREKYAQILKICKEFAILIERSQDRASFEMFGEEEFLDAAVNKIREIVPIQMETSTASGGNIARATASSPRQSERQGSGLLELRLGDMKISVHRGDITEERVDVIVNPANDLLAHDGGVAGAIAMKGGYVITKESRDIISRRRRLNTGDVVTTSSGNLPCKYVVHAVGPEWKKEGPEKSKNILRRACLNSLTEAEEAKADSIALPAIGSGVYGMPKQVCAAVMFDAVEEYSRNKAQGFKVSDVRFVNIDTETVEIFLEEFLKRYASGKGLPSSPSGQDEKSHDPRTQSGTGKPNNNGRRGDRSKVKSPSGSGRDSRQNSGDDHRTPRVGARKSNRADGHQEHHHSSNVDETSVSPGRSYSEVAGSSRLGGGGHINDPLGAAGVKKSEDGDRENECSICLETMKQPKGLKNCKHKFCKACIDEALKHNNRCPVCLTPCGAMKGNQPPGSMTQTTQRYGLPGFERHGTIVINYSFPSGTQTLEHPNPGLRYAGTSRTAYLPDTSEGRKVLQLLRKAFDARLVFTIGTSATTGLHNQVTWNDIHHKTSMYGGPTSFGYPDPTYLSRVKGELAAKGIK